MKRNRKGAKRRPQTIRVWSHDEARGALPYIASVLGSMREHWIDAWGHTRRMRRLAEAPGRPDRTRRLALQDASQRAAEARDRFEEAAEELHSLDIFCTDPLRGEAVIPFVHDEQLAWFIYDHFAPQGLHSWRYHNDPLDTRRPIAEALAGADETPRVA